MTAAIDASSIRANPSDVAPEAILSDAEVRQPVRLQVGVGGGLADLDRPFGERERRVGVAHRPGGLAPDQREVAVRVGFAVGADELLRPALPRGRDRVLARIAVPAGDVDREVRGAKLVALRLVRLEGPLLGRELAVGMRAEERGQGECLEVGARDSSPSRSACDSCSNASSHACRASASRPALSGSAVRA